MQVIKIGKRKFEIGQLVATPGALLLAQGIDLDLFSLLARHLVGDWGDICTSDKAENELSLENDFRLLSAYNTPAGTMWIITEADHSVTTFLLPEEY